MDLDRHGYQRASMTHPSGRAYTLGAQALSHEYVTARKRTYPPEDGTLIREGMVPREVQENIINLLCEFQRPLSVAELVEIWKAKGWDHILEINQAELNVIAQIVFGDYDHQDPS